MQSLQNLEQLRSEAASHGVADLDAAIAELELAEKGSGATLLSEKVRELPCPTIPLPCLPYSDLPALFCTPPHSTLPPTWHALLLRCLPCTCRPSMCSA